MGVKKSRLVAGLTAVLLTGGLALAVPAAAEASTQSASCAGTYVTTKTLKNNNGTVIGRVGIYRDGNYGCAVGVKAGPVYGVPTHTHLYVSGGVGGDWGVDSGNFAYQTNAIRVYSPGHRIRFAFYVTSKSGNEFVRDEIVYY